MKIAIIQPYFFPYIGYFQLINAVDKFVFYEDVNYIKGGWINRNRILINNEAQYLTIPLKNPSQNKLINEIEIVDNYNKLIKTITITYKKAPFFGDVCPIIEDVFTLESRKIADLAIKSVQKVCSYLEISCNFERSSEKYSDSKGIGKAERLIDICKKNNATTYINPIGGIELYSKETFAKENIQLFFLKPNLTEYQQFKSNFVPGLSIIDVTMFNSKEKIKEMLDDYELI